MPSRLKTPTDEEDEDEHKAGVYIVFSFLVWFCQGGDDGRVREGRVGNLLLSNTIQYPKVLFPLVKLRLDCELRLSLFRI